DHEDRRARIGARAAAVAAEQRLDLVPEARRTRRAPLLPRARAFGRREPGELLAPAAPRRRARPFGPPRLATELGPLPRAPPRPGRRIPRRGVRARGRPPPRPLARPREGKARGVHLRAVVRLPPRNPRARTPPRPTLRLRAGKVGHQRQPRHAAPPRRRRE